MDVLLDLQDSRVHSSVQYAMKVLSRCGIPMYSSNYVEPE